VTERETSEERVGTIQGDRICVGCAFNLVGQPILREGRYGLLIARCPECGSVAAMQEYPVLGRWANRWAALLAAGWLMAMLTLLLAPGGALFGGLMGIAGSASGGLSAEIGDRYMDHVVERLRAGVVATSQTESQWVMWLQQAELRVRGTAGASAATPNPALPTTISDEAVEQTRTNLRYWAAVDVGWWSDQDRREIRRAGGGLRGAFARVPAGAWFWLVSLTFAYGVALSVALLGRRRRVVLVVALVPIGFALVLSAIFREPSPTWMGVAGVQASELAREMIWTPLCAGVLAIAYAGVAVGVAIGRPVARLALRALLPAPLCGALAFVWTADGKDPPRPIGRSARS
jgi:hypothetical protein